MYEYGIQPEPNTRRYKEVIALLKAALEVLSEKELHDVDDSYYTTLETPNGKVTVKNSQYHHDLHVVSEFSLDVIVKDIVFKRS